MPSATCLVRRLARHLGRVRRALVLDGAATPRAVLLDEDLVDHLEVGAPRAAAREGERHDRRLLNAVLRGSVAAGLGQGAAREALEGDAADGAAAQIGGLHRGAEDAGGATVAGSRGREG